MRRLDWTEAEHAAICSRAKGVSWARINAHCPARTRAQLHHRWEVVRRRQRILGLRRPPTLAEMGARRGATVPWRRWEDDLIQLLLIHLPRVVVPDYLAAVLGRSREAVRCRIWTLDFDADELTKEALVGKMDW